MPRFQKYNHYNPSGVQKNPDRSRTLRRSPSIHRIRLNERFRRPEMNRTRPRSPLPPNCARYSQWFCLGVFGLSYKTTEGDLRRIFQRYGPIERVNLIYDPMTGKSRGFGFVYLRHKKDALIARDRCNGMLFDKRNIRVALSRTEKPHSPTPGQYMGPEKRVKRERKSHERRRAFDGRVVLRIPRKSPSPLIPFVHPRFRPVGSRSGSSEC